MNGRTRKNKPISFNLKDEHDMALLEHAERINKLTGKPRNFSKYVKKLIESDMNGNSHASTPQFNGVIAPFIQEDDIYNKEVKQAMSSFL